MEKSKFMGMIMNNKNKVDDHGLWDYDHNGEAAGGGGGVYPWPPRSYTCSFCKRQFRSAQALGGHMNIHRRDRARLRQLSPPPPPPPLPLTKDNIVNGNGQFSFLNLNHEPNPNLNLNFSFNQNPNYSTKCPPFTSKLPSLFSSQLSSSNYLPLPSTTTTTTFSETRGGWGKEGMTSRKPTNFGKIRPTKRLLLDHHHQQQQLGGGAISVKEGKRAAEFLRLELEIGLLREENQDLDLELRLGYT